ncbi:MAG: MBL fold metallo-hydrolase [Acidobacteriaceae bacterium]
MSREIARRIRDYAVPKDSVALFWFGQNGFIFKSPEGTLASVDLYLSDSCATLREDIDLRRQIPVLLEPSEVEVDVFACTHNHQDHTDPETIEHLRHKNTMQFVGPQPSCAVFRKNGIDAGRIAAAWPDGVIEHRDLRLTGTFALPTDATDLNHVGFMVQFGKGPRIYVTGDTDHHELLYSAAKYSPDLVITCINGGFNNLSSWEAAQLVSVLRPKLAIGCHYDMFKDNGANPEQFEADLKIQTPDTKFAKLIHGEPFLFSSK